MSTFIYHQTAEGFHVIQSPAEFTDDHASNMIATLADIVYSHQSEDVFAVVDMQGHYVLPLREISSQIKRLYRELPEARNLYLALVVDSSVVNVLSTIVKTLVRRETIQYFTDDEKGRFWLHLERKKRQKRQV